MDDNSRQGWLDKLKEMLGNEPDPIAKPVTKSVGRMQDESRFAKKSAEDQMKELAETAVKKRKWEQYKATLGDAYEPGKSEQEFEDMWKDNRIQHY